MFHSTFNNYIVLNTKWKYCFSCVFAFSQPLTLLLDDFHYWCLFMLICKRHWSKIWLKAKVECSHFFLGCLLLPSLYWLHWPMVTDHFLKVLPSHLFSIPALVIAVEIHSVCLEKSSSICNNNHSLWELLINFTFYSLQTVPISFCPSLCPISPIDLFVTTHHRDIPLACYIHSIV